MALKIATPHKQTNSQILGTFDPLLALVKKNCITFSCQTLSLSFYSMVSSSLFPLVADAIVKASVKTFQDLLLTRWAVNALLGCSGWTVGLGVGGVVGGG